MIYEYPSADAPLRQGDVFIGLPRIDISLKHVPVIAEDETQIDMAWEQIAKLSDPVMAALAVKPVSGIMISQDCDAARAPDITFCEIRSFRAVERKCEQTGATKKWIGIITQQARLNQKWFYLPPDPRIGFTDRMAADFLTTIRVPREELVEMRHLRRGRLNDVAAAHFRERIAEFFRRYPYDEWYSLDPGEMAEYRKEHPDAEPYPWQVSPRG